MDYGDDFFCAICMERAPQLMGMLAPCNHHFCLECLLRLSTANIEVEFNLLHKDAKAIVLAQPCPICRTAFVTLGGHYITSYPRTALAVIPAEKCVCPFCAQSFAVERERLVGHAFQCAKRTYPCPLTHCKGFFQGLQSDYQLLLTKHVHDGTCEGNVTCTRCHATIHIDALPLHIKQHELFTEKTFELMELMRKTKVKLTYEMAHLPPAESLALLEHAESHLQNAFDAFEPQTDDESDDTEEI